MRLEHEFEAQIAKVREQIDAEKKTIKRINNEVAMTAVKAHLRELNERLALLEANLKAVKAARNNA